MKKAERLQMGAVRQQLEQWRERHGGRGRRIPEQLWDAAVEVARADGVDATARALRVDRALLTRRVERASAPSEVVAAGPALEAPRGLSGFVELGARGWRTGGQTLVRFEGRDGEKLQLELSGECAVNVVELARAFWSRGR